MGEPLNFEGKMADDVATAQAQLDAVNQAITNILTTGQSYVRPGLSLTRANLETLRQMQTDLRRQIQRASSGIIAVGEVSGGATTVEDTWNGG